MIDALSLWIPEGTPKRHEYWLQAVRHQERLGSPHAFSVAEPSKFPLFRIHEGQDPRVRGMTGYRVEFVQVRHLTKWDFAYHLHRAFDISDDAFGALKIARVDFAVDIFGVGVEWFLRNARVKYKRTAATFSGWNTKTERGVQTLTFGSHKDQYRIYNKVAERHARGKEFLYAGMLKGEPPPTTTRIERQCVGRCIPLTVSTLGGLLKNAADFKPFEALILPTVPALSNTEGMDAREWLMSLGIKSALEISGGLAALRVELNKRSGGHAKRYLDHYSELLRPAVPLTINDIHKAYRSSTVKQLNPLTGTPYEAAGIVVSL